MRAAAADTAATLIHSIAGSTAKGALNAACAAAATRTLAALRSHNAVCRTESPIAVIRKASAIVGPISRIGTCQMPHSAPTRSDAPSGEQCNRSSSNSAAFRIRVNRV